MNENIIEETPYNNKTQVNQILKYIYKINSKKNNEYINTSIIISEKKNKLPQLILDYLDNTKILETDINFLIKYIKELTEYLKINNNLLIPFLIPTSDLIKSYINSDLDENIIENAINDKNNNINKNNNILKYNHIFLLLKQNSFISKDIIMSIYSYFSNIYNDINNNNQLNKYDFNINKFRKMIKLWKLFYTFNDNKKEYSESSFCSIGGGMLISFHKPFSLENKHIIIKIKFYENNNDIINNNYSDIFNENIHFLNINKIVPINYNYFKEFYENKNIIIVLISFKIFQKQINIIILYKYNNSNEIKKKEIIVKEKTIKDISKIYLLENYIGQINTIKIKLLKKENNKSKCYSEYLYRPLLNIDNDYLRESINEKNPAEKEERNNIYKLKIINKNLFKVNYINYNHKKFHIVDYFGGIIQLLPFANLIKMLYLNEKLNNNIIKKDRKELYISFINDILSGLFHSLLYSKINHEIIKKYFLFVFSILLEMCIIIFKDENNKEVNEKVKLNIDQYIVENMEHIDIEKQRIMQLYIKFINFGTIEYEILIKEIEELVKIFINEEIKFNNNEFQYIISFQHLYTKLMKQLFIFNRFWSNKNIFFKKEYKDIHKIKYKQYNHYTKNYQRPIIYPILELNKYYPKFKYFKVENLYKNNNDKVLNYNFDFFGENNIIIKLINHYIKNMNKNKKEISLKCCLVKNLYHIKGNLILKQIEKNNKLKFKLIFISDNSNNVEGCNIPESEKKDNKNQLCYGSPFPTPNLNYDYIKIIKSKDIIFILKREYFHKVSAIEIFTFNNKIYLFNFYEPFNIYMEKDKYSESNIILLKISEYFQYKIVEHINNKMILLGYYNKRYETYMFPLFYGYLYNNYNYYSNYDKLIITNLFSNRSFNDIYQYPIFPMFYESINLKRDMSQHIGLQSLNKYSKDRKQNILFTYNMNKNISNEEISLFNVFYSNPIFLCNFLLRIFPYSLLSIEFQGSGFDNPNRLFYSIENNINNTLIQKSDLREMIPELFYLPELYNNINELNFGKNDERNEIDNVIIYKNEYNIFDKYKYITQLRDILENEQNLNLWMDLIFGKNQKETKDKIKYYPNENIVNYENNEKIYNDSFNLKCNDFGVIPFQILNRKFPNRDYSFRNNIENIKYYNIKEFDREHSISNIGFISFICKINFLISKEYIKTINKNENNYQINTYEEEKFLYIFKGDIFGNVFIYIISNDYNHRNYTITNQFINYYQNNTKNKIINNSKINVQNEKNNYNHKNIHEIKKILDHNKEIKYIDCNPRLNLFLSYSLDGFINIYTFPKCKLVSVIKISNYIKEEEPLIKVVLISNPFPMIFCYNETNMFVFTINGELINKKEKDKYSNLYPCVDKSLGLIKDNIRIKKRITDKIISDSEIDLPFLNYNI